MPIYEYECGLCNCQFERKQSFTDAPVISCPNCQGEARRVLRSVPVIFKGGGFYVTDNRKDGGGEESFDGIGEEKEGNLAGVSESDGT